MSATVKGELIAADSVMCRVRAGSRDEVLKLAADHLKQAGYVTDGFFQALLKRENMFPTGICFGDTCEMCIRDSIQSAENCTSGQFSSNAVTEIAYYLCIVYLRQGKNGAVTTDGEISRLPEYRAAELVTGRMEALGMKIAEEELCYIATVMMGARLQQFNETYGNREPILSEFAEDLLRTFEQKALVEFPDKTRLKEQLMVHLRPMYYRLKYSIHVDHQFSGIVIQQYRDLYNLTDLAVKTVEDKYGFRVPAEEIAYLAIFFGSFVKYHGSREKSQSGTILIVCAAGVSSAMLIRQQLIFLLGSGYTYEICDKRHVSEMCIRDRNNRVAGIRTVESNDGDCVGEGYMRNPLSVIEQLEKWRGNLCEQGN